MNFKYSNNLDFMGEVCTLLKKIHLRIYNRYINKQIVTFIREIYILPSLEDLGRNKKFSFFLCKKGKPLILK